MKRFTTWKYFRQLVLILAILAVLCYMLHVILGTINYPGYDSFRQPVSDLTADGSPSVIIARRFSNFYGILTSVVSILLLVIRKEVKHDKLRLGVTLISIMYLLSAIGYALFPLAHTTTTMNFQNIMHVVVTILVVLLTIASLIILMIAFYQMKHNGFFTMTIITFLLMMSGAIMTNLVSEAYLGFFERFSVFSAVIYHMVIPYFRVKYPN